MPKYHRLRSALAVPIAGYIVERRALGHKFEKGENLLRCFDSFADIRDLRHPDLPKQLVLEWTARRPNETTSTQSGRISLLRGLATYMNRVGYAAYVYPKAMTTVSRYAYIPYIFSSEEIKSIFKASDQYPLCDVTPNRHLVLPLLLRILYGCGLRISEALHLTLQDVDLEGSTLFIRHGKFNKERILPMADSLTKRCREYIKVAGVGRMGNPFLFPSPFGGHYSASTTYKLFRDVLWRSGISHLGRGKGPRIHDLRHTFAVNCLKQWVLNGRELNNALPYLSAYLGHEDLRGTQRYLRLTADLFPDLVSRVENTCAYIIPEVNWDEAN